MYRDKPFALFLTWTCYGTWLPGDTRGHVSNIIVPGEGFIPRQNEIGSSYAEGDKYTHARAAKLQKHATVWLTKETATWAAEGLIAAAAPRRWQIVRAAIMSNHMHLLVRECPDDGPAVRRVFNGVSQAHLSQRAGRAQRWWTAGGSDRYLHDDSAIEAVFNYIAQQVGILVEIIDNCIVMPGERRGLSPP